MLARTPTTEVIYTLISGEEVRLHVTSLYRWLDHWFNRMLNMPVEELADIGIDIEPSFVRAVWGPPNMLMLRSGASINTCKMVHPIERIEIEQRVAVTRDYIICTHFYCLNDMLKTQYLQAAIS